MKKKKQKKYDAVSCILIPLNFIVSLFQFYMYSMQIYVKRDLGHHNYQEQRQKWREESREIPAF